MEFYSFILTVSVAALLVGGFFSLMCFVLSVIVADKWYPVNTEEALAPLFIGLGIGLAVATLGVPVLLVFLYKCKKLFWQQ